jgi:nucleoside-diphosphate kinase
MEREFIMIKPDGVQRGLIGEIITRIENTGLKITAIKMIQVSDQQAEKHYEVHKGKPFYEGLIKYITSGPVVTIIVEGKNAVKHVRRLVGSTDPSAAAPGSIRGDFALEIGRNIIHAADSNENAAKEALIYFSENEVVKYNRINETWLYE